jgi:hypothetical protein
MTPWQRFVLWTTAATFWGYFGAQVLVWVLP